MKKVLAIVLVLVLAMALVACGGEKEPKEKPLTIGFNTNSLTNETMTFMVDVMTKYCDENGIKFMSSQDGGDTATLQNNLENMVAGGCDGIIFMNYDPQGVEPILQELKSKGVALVSYDEASTVCDYAWHCANYDLGYAIGKMCCEWANENVPGTDPVECGLLAADGNNFLKERGDGIEQGLKDNMKNGAIVYRSPISGGSLETYANLWSAHPNISLFTSIADSVVVGIAEAWYGDLVGNNLPVEEHGVFSTDATDIALNLINKSREGLAVYRGTIDLGLKDVIPLGMIKCCHAAIEGRDAGYPQESFYAVKFVTAENIDEYSAFLD